jgi:Uma2 family endonuclease
MTYARSMATSSAVPVEEYLRTTYHPDMEYLEGQLVERHVGEYFHSRLQSLIIGLLLSREPERRFRVFTEQRVKVSDRPRYRIPDICAKALPHQITPILLRPDLAIEVVSPDDEAAAMLAKIGDYLAAGIPHIWVVDPYKRTLVEADQNGIRQPETLVLATPLVGEIDFAPLFQQLDEPAE